MQFSAEFWVFGTKEAASCADAYNTVLTTSFTLRIYSAGLRYVTKVDRGASCKCQTTTFGVDGLEMHASNSTKVLKKKASTPKTQTILSSQSLSVRSPPVEDPAPSLLQTEAQVGRDPLGFQDPLTDSIWTLFWFSRSFIWLLETNKQDDVWGRVGVFPDSRDVCEAVRVVHVCWFTLVLTQVRLGPTATTGFCVNGRRKKCRYNGKWLPKL